ncbi:hypothetical protein ALC62_13488 [Cyphomyrmex costatus]|uniref:C2H2-type domain-containing protein n=1 Tax=Cyphomyrmex costatus TaxID=456900 RepID=A0A151K2J0_9HYME|nr:hypothetical protein ALC62_13488 [Cyphomyrmex costatus]
MILKHNDDERFKSNKDLYAGGVLHKCGTCTKEFKNKSCFLRHERTHIGEKPHQCEFCKYKSKYKKTLRQHVVAKHNNDERFKSNKDLYTGGVSYKCKMCNKEFVDKSKLHMHERTHTGEKPYQCEFCVAKFGYKEVLRQHVVAKHYNDERFKSNKDLYTEGVSYKCKTCNKEFKNKTNCHKHERIHTSEKPYQCEFCENKFRYKKTLRQHVVAKHNNDERFKSNKDLYTRGVSYKCKTCNKEFKKKSNFHMHERTHTGEKPYQCEFCVGKFGYKKTLIQHMVTKHNNDERFKFNKDLYTGGVSYKCKTCNKEFMDKTNCHRHERIHTGEKPYQCEFCVDKFGYKEGLTQHVMTKHNNDERFKSNKDLYTGGVSYKCKTCNKEFINNSKLHMHERTHTGEKPYQCEFCVAKFGNKVVLRQHMVAKHNNDERFKSNKDLYAGGVSYKCKTCNKEFKNKTHLRSHERIHTGEKPYQCEFCRYKFRLKVQLSNHMILKHNDDERFKSNKDLYAGGVLHKCGTCTKEFKFKSCFLRHERTHTGKKPYECEFCKYKCR